MSNNNAANTNAPEGGWLYIILGVVAGVVGATLYGYSHAEEEMLGYVGLAVAGAGGLMAQIGCVAVGVEIAMRRVGRPT